MLIKQERIPVREIILVGFLPAFLKKLIYRLRGYRIGRDVSFGFGSILCGDQVTVGDHTSLGFFTIIRGKTIKIGSHVTIGSITFLDTPHLEIGDGSRINEQVLVGGLQFPDSRLVLGRNCQVMQGSYLNPARGITMGEDSGIGGDCMVFGHYSWLSLFEGYPVEFAPIEIGKSVSVAWRVFLLPGTKIGDGAVIGANSLVQREIPPRCLAVGFPARVVSRPPDFPKPVAEDEKIGMLRRIVEDMLSYFSGYGLQWDAAGVNRYVVKQGIKTLWGRRERTFTMEVRYPETEESRTSAPGDRVDLLVSLASLPQELRRDLDSQKTMWIDIEKKECPRTWNDLGEEVALFLKRYGVRLTRVDQ